MATINTRYVDPDAAAGGDGTTTALSGANCAYVSLSAWEAARQADLPTGDIIEKAVCCSNGASHTADTTNLSIDGWTTDATRYIWITVESGSRHAGVWSNSKYRLDAPSNCAIYVWEDFVLIDGLQLSLQAASSYGHIRCRNQGSTARIYICNCIIDGEGRATAYAIQAYNPTSGAIHTIWNCIIYNFSGNGIAAASATPTVNIYNCTISGCTNGISRTDGTVTVKNCAVFNNTDDFNGTITVDYCASDDGDGTNAVDISPGATEATDWASAFTDYANGDFSVKDTDSVLYGAGIVQTGVTTDIIGTSRGTVGNACDIGAFEYVVSGGGGASIIPRLDNYYRQMRGNA